MNGQDFGTEAKYAKSFSEQQLYELRQESSVDKFDRDSQMEALTGKQENEVDNRQIVSDRKNMTTIASRKARIFCLTVLAIYVVAHQFVLAD